jgi:hypothetical protein
MKRIEASKNMTIKQDFMLKLNKILYLQYFPDQFDRIQNFTHDSNTLELTFKLTNFDTLPNFNR